MLLVLYYLDNSYQIKLEKNHLNLVLSEKRTNYIFAHIRHNILNSQWHSDWTGLFAQTTINISIVFPQYTS